MQDIIYHTFESVEEAIKSGEANIQIKASRPDLTPLTNAQHIKALSLNDNALYPKLLAPITSMPDLEFLNLSGNYLKALPSLQMPKLKGIDLANIDGLDIMKTFEVLSSLPALEYVCIKGCNVQRIKGMLPQLPTVRIIDIRGTAKIDLIKLRKSLPKLDDILINRSMSIPYKELFDILSKIPNFQHLELYDTQRAIIPPNIKKLKALTSLKITLPRLVDPSSLSELTSLRSLSIDAERVNPTELFESIKDLPIEKLHIHQIDYLTESITAMQSLRELSFELYTSDRAHFEQMFRLLPKIPKLEVLHLVQNAIFDYPQDIGKLSHLKTIRLDFTKEFVSLPKEVAFFTNTRFEGRQRIMSRLNEYVEIFGKDESLTDTQKLMYFGFMLDQRKVLEEVLEDPFVNFEPQKSVILVVGHITGYTQKEIKDKLKEYGFKVATKLHSKVTHVLIGKHAKEEILKEVIESSQYQIVIEEQLKNLFVTTENPFLMDANDENFDDMNSHVIDLLLSVDDTNVQVGLTMMEDGGASVQSLSVLYGILLTTDQYKAQTKQLARKVFKRYASSTLQNLLKNRIPFFDAVFQQNDIDPLLAIAAYVNKDNWNNFTITYEILDQVGWDGIKQIISRCHSLKTVQMSFLNMDQIPDIFPPDSSIQRLIFNNNPVQELPQSLLKLKELEHISFENCKIKDIKLLLQFSKLKKVYAKDNPMEKVPSGLRRIVKRK